MERNREDMYKQMFTIRKVEELLLQFFTKGLLRGTVHTCYGQEACAVGVLSAINKEIDIVSSNHRGHGHYLAYCDDIKGLVLEIMGHEDGVCGGLGGSQHLQNSNFYSNGILGGMPPVAVGMGFAEKIKKSGAISVVFFGDGAMAEGNIYEAFNFAALWKAPVLFVVEHNQYAQSTHFSLEHAGELQNRAIAFGIKSTVVNGNLLDEVFANSSRIVNEIRENNLPQLLFLNTYRLGPHSKGDDLRSTFEIEENKKNDPLVLYKQKHNSINFDLIENTVNSRIDEFLKSINKN